VGICLLCYHSIRLLTCIKFAQKTPKRKKEQNTCEPTTSKHLHSKSDIKSQMVYFLYKHRWSSCTSNATQTDTNVQDAPYSTLLSSHCGPTIYLYRVLEKRKNCRKFITKKFGISNSSFSHRLLGHWALEKIWQRIIAKRSDKVRHRGFALVFFRVRNAEFVVE